MHSHLALIESHWTAYGSSWLINPGLCLNRANGKREVSICKSILKQQRPLFSPESLQISNLFQWRHPNSIVGSSSVSNEATQVESWLELVEIRGLYYKFFYRFVTLAVFFLRTRITLVVGTIQAGLLRTGQNDRNDIKMPYFFQNGPFPTSSSFVFVFSKLQLVE